MNLAYTLGMVILALVFTPPPPPPPVPNPDFAANLVRFHLHYDSFLRTYFGCPKAAVSVEDCHPELGTLDYSEFNHAAHEARSLFALEKDK